MLDLDALDFAKGGGLVTVVTQDADSGAVLMVAHADREALERTYNATPDPKWVVAIGDCARDGGCFAGSYAVVGGVSEVVPVDLHIPGCPPTPTAMLQGLLALLERVDAGAVTS